MNTSYRGLLWVGIMIALLAGGSPFLMAQSPTLKEDREKALSLANENRYIDAYPVLEKIATSYPNDVQVWTHFGIAILVHSTTLEDPEKRKEARVRGYLALTKAKQLGTDDVMALDMLDQLSPDGGDADNFIDENPEVEKALREGEAYFGKGDYEKAFASYERAFKLNPRSYEAAVFAGDTFYAQRKYAESEPWFAKAAAIDPDREMAYRFWGDALLGQGKTREAQEKFIDAFVAQPYSRYTFENINKLTSSYEKQFDVKGIFPPGTEGFQGITIDVSGLKESDGSAFWLKYVEVRTDWRRETFSKLFPSQPYRHTLEEEMAALIAVADLAARAIKAGELSKPHHSLVNLIELRDKGMIEPYILLLTPNESLAEDYLEYRESNRAKLRKFLVEHVFVF